MLGLLQRGILSVDLVHQPFLQTSGFDQYLRDIAKYRSDIRSMQGPGTRKNQGSLLEEGFTRLTW